jgi:hypothetical protein
MSRTLMIKTRGRFYPREARTFCPCEGCRLRFGRLFETTRREFPYWLRPNLRLGWVNHANRRRWQHSDQKR